jgi:hypothetical protein
VLGVTPARVVEGGRRVEVEAGLYAHGRTAYAPTVADRDAMRS